MTEVDTAKLSSEGSISIRLRDDRSRVGFLDRVENEC